MPRINVDLRPTTIDFHDGQHPIVNGIANFGATMARLPVQLAELRMRQAEQEEDRRRFEAELALNQAKFNFDKGQGDWAVIHPGEQDTFGAYELDRRTGTQRPVYGGEAPAPTTGQAPAAPAEPTTQASMGGTPAASERGVTGYLGDQVGRAAAVGTGALAGTMPSMAGAVLGRSIQGAIPLAEGAMLGSTPTLFAGSRLAMSPAAGGGVIGLGIPAMAGLGRDLVSLYQDGAVPDEALSMDLAGQAGRATAGFAAGAQPETQGPLAPADAASIVNRYATSGRTGDSHGLREAIGGGLNALAHPLTSPREMVAEGSRNVQNNAINSAQIDLTRAIISLPFTDEQRAALKSELDRAVQAQYEYPDSKVNPLQTFARMLQNRMGTLSQAKPAAARP